MHINTLLGRFLIRDIIFKLGLGKFERIDIMEVERMDLNNLLYCDIVFKFEKGSAFFKHSLIDSDGNIHGLNNSVCIFTEDGTLYYKHSLHVGGQEFKPIVPNKKEGLVF